MDVGIRHALGGADDAFDNFKALDAARGTELHDATENEAIFPRGEGCRCPLTAHGEAWEWRGQGK